MSLIVYPRLNVLKFGMAFGASFGLGMLFLGIVSTYFNWGTAMVPFLSSVYIGYKSSLLGSLLGLVWGCIDGFIGGVLIAFFYNLFLGK